MLSLVTKGAQQLLSPADLRGRVTKHAPPPSGSLFLSSNRDQTIGQLGGSICHLGDRSLTQGAAFLDNLQLATYSVLNMNVSRAFVPFL